MASNMYANSNFTPARPARPPPPSTGYAAGGNRDPRTARGYRPPPPITAPRHPNFRPPIGGRMTAPPRTPGPPAGWAPPAQQSRFPSFTPENPLFSAFLEGTRMAAMVTGSLAANQQTAQASVPVAAPPAAMPQQQMPLPQCAACRSLRSVAVCGTSKEGDDDDLSDVPETIRLKLEQQKESNENLYRQNQELLRAQTDFKKRIEDMADRLKKKELKIKELEERLTQPLRDMAMVLDAEQRAVRRCDALEGQVAALTDSSKEMSELYRIEVEKMSSQQSKIDSLEACTRRLKTELQEKSLRIHFLQNLVKSPPTPAPPAAAPENRSTSGLTNRSSNHRNPFVSSALTPEQDITSDLPEDFLESPASLTDPMLSDAASQPETTSFESSGADSGAELMIIDGNDSASSLKSRPLVAEMNQDSSLSSLDISPSKTIGSIMTNDGLKDSVGEAKWKPGSIGLVAPHGGGTIPDRLSVESTGLGSGSPGSRPTIEPGTSIDQRLVVNKRLSTSSNPDSLISKSINDVIASMDEASRECEQTESNTYLVFIPSGEVVNTVLGNSVHLDSDIKVVGRVQQKYVGIHDYRKRPMAAVVKEPMLAENESEKIICLDDESPSPLSSNSPVLPAGRKTPVSSLSDVLPGKKGMLEVMIERLETGMQSRAAASVGGPSSSATIGDPPVDQQTVANVANKAKGNPAKPKQQGGSKRGRPAVKNIARPFLERNRLQLFKCTLDRSCMGKFESLAALKFHLKANHKGETVFCRVFGCPRYFAREAMLNRHLQNFHRYLSFYCSTCAKYLVFKNRPEFESHVENAHPHIVIARPDVSVVGESGEKLTVYDEYMAIVEKSQSDASSAGEGAPQSSGIRFPPPPHESKPASICRKPATRRD